MKNFNLQRSDIFISTKIPPNLQGKNGAKQSIEASLKDLDL